MSYPPGKFEANEDQALAEHLYGICGDGFQSDEIGDAATTGWFALIFDEGAGYIVREDSNGFFTIIEGPEPGPAIKVKWERLSRDVAEGV